MADNDFLPTAYEVPQASNGYMKFKPGANRFRILSNPILGWEYWNVEDGKKRPYRVRQESDLRIEHIQEPDKIKHFWAMVVWNYNEEKIQILEITQKGILKNIRALVKDEDWGNPQGYDLVVTKTGEMKETEYSTQPKPAKTLDKSIKQKFDEAHINLEALYDGKDPFSKIENKMNENVNPDDIPF